MKACVTSRILNRRADGTPVPFTEVISFAKEAGFEEFDMTLPARLYRQADWERELDARGEALAKAGMRVKYVHLPYDYPAADAEEGWARYDEAVRHGIDWTRRYGADCAAIHPRTFMTEDYDLEREYEDALAFLRPFCEYAHGADVALAIEIMRGAGRSAPARIRRFGTDTGDLIRMADALDEGICWDTGHAQISMQDPCRSIFRVGRRLRMVHINDNFGEDDVHLAPFLGNLPWDDVLRALREVGYAGSMNVEVSCSRLPEELRKPYAAYMGAACRYLIDRFEEKN